MRSFLLSLIVLFSAAQTAKAEIAAYVIANADKWAPITAHIGMWAADRLHFDPRKRTIALQEYMSDIDEIIADLGAVDDGLSELKNLVEYRELQRKSRANLLRLSGYLKHCQNSEYDNFCASELADLMGSARALSSEARVLDVNSISIAIVSSAQEMDLLLADVSESLVWSQLIESEYDTYWSSLLEERNESSLTNRLSALEAQQSYAIERGFGIKYDGGPIAEYEEFLDFKTWVKNVGSRALATQSSMNCVVFDSTLGGALFGGVRAVDFIEDGENILRLDPVYTAAIYRGERENNNTSIKQAPGLTTFEFFFDVKLKSTSASRRAKYQDAMSIFTKRNCRLYAGDQGEIQNYMFQESAHFLEPLEIAINKPVFEMLKLRKEIKLAEAASQRIDELG